MNRYVLEQRVGEGGVAEVFRGKHIGPEGLERTVAIKRLLPEFHRDQDLRTRLIDEARISARLNHSNIVSVIDLYENPAGRLHLVTDFVDGVSFEHLVHRCASARFIAPGIISFMLLEAARAIAYTHKKGVLHRDLSCSNLLASREGEVKLVDFGLADATGRLSSTTPGILNGKLDYLSPERRAGQKGSPQDDLFSLGVVLERLLLACDPRVRRSESVARLEQLRERLVAPLSQRLPSATALVQELRAFERADAEELAELVRNNPKPRDVPAPQRLQIEDLDAPTDAGAETTTEASRSAPALPPEPRLARPPAPLRPARLPRLERRPSRTRRRALKLLLPVLLLLFLFVLLAMKQAPRVDAHTAPQASP